MTHNQQLRQAAEEYAAKFYKQHQSLRRTSFLKGASAQSKIDREAMDKLAHELRRIIVLTSKDNIQDAREIAQAALKLTEKQ